MHHFDFIEDYIRIEDIKEDLDDLQTILNLRKEWLSKEDEPTQKKHSSSQAASPIPSQPSVAFVNGVIVVEEATGDVDDKSNEEEGESETEDEEEDDDEEEPRDLDEDEESYYKLLKHVERHIDIDSEETIIHEDSIDNEVTERIKDCSGITTSQWNSWPLDPHFNWDEAVKDYINDNYNSFTVDGSTYYVINN